MGTSSDKKKYTFQLCGIIDSKNQDYFLSGTIFPKEYKSIKFDETNKKKDPAVLEDNGQNDSIKLGVNQNQVRVLNNLKNPNGNEYPMITSKEQNIDSTKKENIHDKNKINGGEINSKYDPSSNLKKGEEFEENNLGEDFLIHKDGKEEDEQSTFNPNLSNISFENNKESDESQKNSKAPNSLIKSIIQEPIKEDFGET